MKTSTSHIASRSDFMKFLEELASAYQRGGGDWENKDLGNFLQAASAWVGDLDGYYQNIGERESVDLAKGEWRVFADILMAATMYE